MLFNSLQFLVFFPAVVALYFLTPFRLRWILLLSASYYFYACWKVEYLALILFSTAVDYIAGLRMEASARPSSRRFWLGASLISNLGLLFAFKYFNFFNDSLRAAFDAFNVFYDVPAFQVLLPVGISFYTFQTLSYTIDVYRGERKAERHLGIFALYVAFFPQLVAGPIERSTRLMPQFFEHHGFSYDRAVDGLRLMLWGFFKKLVIADHIAVYVNAVYNNPADFTGLPVWIASYFFAFQIYCDFSGYSDIAIGSARVLGYDLMENFRRPYFSKSIAEFWRRWHISLSTWFRDYVYIPLGGSRVARRRLYYNLMVVFVVSGLWHGANWTFVVWGALHGAYMVASLLSRGLRDRLWTTVGEGLAPLARRGWMPDAALLRRHLAVFVTFHLVLFAWVFFRANTIGDAAIILDNLFTFDSLAVTIPAFGFYDLLLAAMGIGFMEGVHLLERKRGVVGLVRGFPTWLRWGVYYGMTMWILLFGAYGKEQAFIYFQF